VPAGIHRISFADWAWLTQFWMSTVLSVAPAAAAPLVGVLSATAPQLVIEIELAGWVAAAGAFQTSTELIQ